MDLRHQRGLEEEGDALIIDVGWKISSRNHENFYFFNQLIIMKVMKKIVYFRWVSLIKSFIN